MHYRPEAPGALLGYLKNGRPFYLIAGGSGEGDDGSGDGGPDSSESGDEAGQQDGGGESGDAGSGRDAEGHSSGSGDNGGSVDAAKTERTITAIRQEFKAERAKRQAAEKEVADIKAALDADKAERTRQMDALAIALGLKSGDEPPDPAKLAEELKAARATATAEISQRDANLRQAQVELAVLRTAAKHGGNGDALLDSRSFMAKVSGLDPAADGFGEQLGDAIKAAVEDGPQYKTPAPKTGNGAKPVPVVARSGGEHTTPGGNRQWTIEDVRAVSKTDPQAVTKAIEDGLLVDLGYSPSKKRR